ncbi:Linear gramicidin synthase subunit D [Penicillium chrysogenum]|uniref:Linear gramicidin synthase subunit D n=1 Tax=Penicillium chrysogenum TaxID=5076 RepID=A0A167Q026_PENCH|nr:Linear gramicidin synthase subunit D [Penicillium chrysogenum]
MANFNTAMEKIIYEHSKNAPNSIAVEDGNLSLSYPELLAEASHLAHTLGDVVSGELVGILLGPGIHQIVAQLAVRLSGGTCVPIEPTLPKGRIIALLGDSGVRRVFVDEEDTAYLHDLEVIHVQPISGRIALDLVSEDFESRSEISHVLFTSRSTGKPKPVQIRAESILHMATKTPATPLRRVDRVTAFNNPGFDVSLFEMWVTLISGATIVVMPRKTATDPGAFGSFLKSHNVTVTFVTAALFQIIAFADPSAFSSLRHVFNGGDVANVRAMRTVLDNGPPQYLWNTYGPTECTTLATMVEVTIEEASRERISIGRAVGETVLVLLDEHQNPIRDSGTRGEIYIGGPQQSLGYLNWPNKTSQSFVHLERRRLGLQGEGTVRLYRTGDMAEWRDGTNLLDFIGRTDSQVKHGGFRVELGEIERALLSHRDVQSVVVVRQPPLSENGTHALVAFVVGSESFQPQHLLEYTRELLPVYMVPNAVERIAEFPLTPNGKADRNALIQLRLETLQGKSSVHGNTSRDKRAMLQGIWRDLLNVPNVCDDDDFFVIGGSSLQAAALISIIQKRLGTLVSMEDLHKNSRLDRLLRLIDTTDCAHGNAPDDATTWRQDVDLVDDIELVPQWEADTEGRVFITGATGIVGALLLSRLMKRPSVKQVACLARRKKGLSAATRIQQTLERNVKGTCNTLRLASAGRRKAFHYMSSIDAWGPTGGILGTKELYEDEPLERHIHCLRYDLGYSQSQWTAEAMVRRMRDRGLPISIYRPGFIVGDSKTGTNNPDDFLSRLIVGCIQLGAFPRIDQRLEYVTVDYVIDSLMHIASDNKNLGKSYSLLAPDVRQSVDVEGTCAVLNEAGYDVKLVSYEEWMERLSKMPEDGPLAPLMPMFQEKVLGRLTRWEASQYSPVYRCDNTVEALKGHPDIEFTPFDVTLLEKSISFWNRKGFYHVRK